MEQENLFYKKIKLQKLNQIVKKMFNDFNFTSMYYFNEIINSSEILNYYFFKSWRSSILEGNTTNLVQYKNISKSLSKKNYDKNDLLVNTFDEQFEMFNLFEAYKSYLTDIDFKTKYYQKINYILGKNIIKNDFDKYRGKLKQANNYVTNLDFKKNITFYNYFADFNDVKNLLEILNEFLKINLLNNKNLDFNKVFIIACIFHLEFSRIHPFYDGNGRTSRLFFEKIFEDNNFFPLIFSKKDLKKKYKKLLFETDLINQSNQYDYENYLKTMYNFYLEETKYFIKNKNKMLVLG